MVESIYIDEFALCPMSICGDGTNLRRYLRDILGRVRQIEDVQDTSEQILRLQDHMKPTGRLGALKLARELHWVPGLSVRKTVLKKHHYRVVENILLVPENTILGQCSFSRPMEPPRYGSSGQNLLCVGLQDESYSNFGPCCYHCRKHSRR